MVSIDYATLKTKLRELNSSLVFDESDNEWYWTGNEYRTGIFYNGNHITNVDRGDIPQKPVQAKKIARLPVGVHEASTNPNGFFVQEWFNEDQQFCGMLNQLMGNVDEKIVKLPPDNKEVLLQRKFDYGKHHIAVVYGFVTEATPGPIVRMGWEMSFKYLLAAKIPGITKEALEEAFAVRF